MSYIYALVVFILGVIFVAALIIFGKLIAPRHITDVKLQPYECGMATIGETWTLFPIRFYVYALVFVLFDVEVAFLFPWAVVFKKLGLFAFWEMMIFLGLLAVGLVYAWRKGVLTWE